MSPLANADTNTFLSFSRVPGGHYHLADFLYQNCTHTRTRARAHAHVQTHTCTFYRHVHLAHGLQVYWWMRYLVPSAAPGFLLSRCFPSNSPCLGIATDPRSSFGSGIFISVWPAKQNPSVTAGLFWHKLFLFFWVTFQGLYLIYACFKIHVCTH